QEKGQRLVSKAFGNLQSKGMRFLRSKPSKDLMKLLWQVSFKSYKASTSESNRLFCNPLRFSYKPTDADRRSSDEQVNDLRLSWLLFPEISVIPEINYL